MKRLGQVSDAFRLGKLNRNYCTDQIELMNSTKLVSNQISSLAYLPPGDMICSMVSLRLHFLNHRASTFAKAHTSGWAAKCILKYRGARIDGCVAQAEAIGGFGQRV